MDEAVLQQRAAEVIKPLIPSDAKERVERSFKQWNQIVREHIRTETGLKLGDSDGRYAIPVRIEQGFPTTLAHLINRHNDPILWRLIVGQPKLGGVIDGLQYLLKDWQDFERWASLPGVAVHGGAALSRSIDVVLALQATAMIQHVRKDIQAIHEDILGCYRIFPTGMTCIELFWMPVAMVAAMLDVRIEDLTVVVLAHELAHGYTHLGRDIDGGRWDDFRFQKCDLQVKEGLAQFYTHAVAERLAARTPGIKLAYEALLTMQSGPYRTHETWLKDHARQQGETVRFTMINARSLDGLRHEDWLRLLNETTGSLDGRPMNSNRDSF